MKQFDLTLKDLTGLFPDDFTEEQIAKAKTVFLKALAYRMHKFYRGKMMTVPKAGLYGFNWFNVWYTPGVSKVSTSIREDNEVAYELSNKGNLIGVLGRGLQGVLESFLGFRVRVVPTRRAHGTRKCPLDTGFG